MSREITKPGVGQVPQLVGIEWQHELIPVIDEVVGLGGGELGLAESILTQPSDSDALCRRGNLREYFQGPVARPVVNKDDATKTEPQIVAT